MQSWGVIVVLACASPALAAPSKLQKECDAARGKQPATKLNPLAAQLTKGSEPIRSIVVRRLVQCAYVGKKFKRADEGIHLVITTQDRGDIQFDTKNPKQKKSYFVECDGALIAGLGKGATDELWFNCVHRIYRSDGAEPDRVTGVDSYRPQQGSAEILSVNGSTFTVSFDGTVANKFEKLRLQGEATGVASTSVQTWDCSPPKPGTKPERPAVCR